MGVIRSWLSVEAWVAVWDRAEIGGVGIDSGASAARTSERGFGKSTAMRGARGRERRYEKSEPVAVMKVKTARAGMGSNTDPTRMF